MRTARLRFTIMYVALFMLSGVALLALTGLLTISRTTSVAAPTQQQPQAARIAELEARLAATQQDQARQLLGGSVIALAVMGAASVLLGRAVAGRVLRPLRTITAATRAITADNLHQRLSAPGPDDEVKALADTIDDLLERLEQAFAAQRRFVANASHELRTPLATMRAALDVAVAKPQPAPPQTTALADRLRTELDRVDHLLEGFLVLARAQHGTLADGTPVSLGELVSQAVTARAAAIAAKSLTLDETDISDTAWTRGSPALLSRMADNVIDNAVIHNRHGGWIRLSTRTAAASAQLVVETGGAILDPEQIVQLTQPFRRLAPDRTGSETGSGLGLSIVTAIVGAHGGRLDLHARSEGGLRVTIALPLAAAPHGVAE